MGGPGSGRRPKGVPTKKDMAMCGPTRLLGPPGQPEKTGPRRPRGRPNVVAPSRVGKRYGQLTVLALVGRRDRQPLYLVRCDCGREYERCAPHVGSRCIKCMGAERRDNLNGQVFNGWRVVENAGPRNDHASHVVECVACAAKRRMLTTTLRKGPRPHRCDLHVYAVECDVWNRLKACRKHGECVLCSEWARSLTAFVAGVGRCPGSPADWRVEAIDPSRPIGPGNWRWARARKTTPYTHRGLTMPLSGWAEHLGVSLNTLNKRVAQGETGDRLFAVLTPGKRLPRRTSQAMGELSRAKGWRAST